MRLSAGASSPSWNTDISSYISQISASEEEASALQAQISSADNSIALLIQQAEAEKAAQEAAEEAAREAEEAAAEEDTEAEEDYGYDASEDTTESSSESTSSTVIVEEVEEDVQEGASSESSSSEESSSEESSSASGQGTYLGNFTLTAYCNCAQCCGTAGNLTASGTVPAAGRTVAMAGVPFGTQLMINGNVYTVEDLGTPYGHVDIYFDSHSDALAFGLQTADVYQVG